MLVSNWETLLANNKEPEGSLGPASGGQDHEEALNVSNTGGVVYTHSWAVEEVYSAFFNQPC